MFKKTNVIIFIMFIGIILSISASPATYFMEINNIVQFEEENEEIGLTQMANLDAVCNQLNKHPNVPVVIIGHYTNEYGIQRMDSLSALKRASETRKYLLNHGINNDIIIYVDMFNIYNTTDKSRIVTFKWLHQIINEIN